jgi:Tol biopolymer transport system component
MRAAADLYGVLRHLSYDGWRVISEKMATLTDAPLVRAELDRILASELFARSDRLSSFLRFIVERTLSGDGASLKEHVIACELYGKDASFDTADDPIVRIDARRLRDKLREYYAGAGIGPVVISVPKGRYTPVFTTAALTLDDSHVDTVSAAGAPGSKTWPAVRRWPLAAVAVALIAAVAWFAKSRIDSGPQLRPFTVTSFPGSEEDPALSPDGESVAFSWSKSDDENHDIWIKSVTGEAKRNLTNTPETSEDWPRWSPHGDWITFSRHSTDGWAVFKISPLGGAEQLIASDAYDASWTPDSGALIMTSVALGGRHGLVYLDLEAGARRTLTDAPVGFEDRNPRVSPDGEKVAFVRTGQGRSAIFVVPLAAGAAVPVGEWAGGLPIGGLEWMPNGRELLAAKWTGSIRRLTRIPVSGRGPEVTVAGLPYDVAGLSVSRLGPPYRLAVSTGQPDIGLRLLDLATPPSAGMIAADSPFCDATHTDIAGRFSRDGERVAFASNRDGSFQVYVANRDGSALRPVTHLNEAMVGVGSWSPEGGRVAFDVTVHNHTDIYSVAIGSGAVTHLGDGIGNASDPE